MTKRSEDTNIYYGYRTNLGVYSGVQQFPVTCVKADTSTEGVDITSILDIQVGDTAFIVFADCTDYDSGGRNDSHTHPLGIFKTKKDVVDFLDKLDIHEQKRDDIQYSGLPVKEYSRQLNEINQIETPDGQEFTDLNALPWHQWGTSLNDIAVTEVIIADAKLTDEQQRRRSFSVSWM